MIDLQNRLYSPSLEEIAEYIRNPVFTEFTEEIKSRYKCDEKIEYSSCSMERGWNVKFRKVGKTLCTIYPRETYFTVMVVIGRKEKEEVESILSDLSPELIALYNRTREANAQRWLMIDVEDKNRVYEDVLRLIEIRRSH